jgi:secreted protein with Ig-like and vWFA domain
MTTVQIDILNPKAEKLLQDLADLDLISIKDLEEDNFLKIVRKLRKKAEKFPPSLDDITKEVELIRAKRYAKEKR